MTTQRVRSASNASPRRRARSKVRTFDIFNADENKYRGHVEIRWDPRALRRSYRAVCAALRHLPSFPHETPTSDLEVYPRGKGILFVDDRRKGVPLYQLLDADPSGPELFRLTRAHV